MKTRLSLVILLLVGFGAFAQNGINYKAVIKDGTGAIVANDLIQVNFNILDGTVIVYQESHIPTTDDNGIIIVNIGEGLEIFGTFATIDWSSNNHYLNVFINTGAGPQDMGTTAFKTVPYALMAQDVENTIWTKSGSDVAYSEANGRVGIGTANPFQPFSVLQPTGSANTVRIESQDHPTGKDLLELQIPAGSTSGSQFIEMQNGGSIVAVVNGDGSARFKSVQFEDFTTQTTAAKGPVAYGFVQSAGTTSSSSGNYSSAWVAGSNRYEITITGETYFFTAYTTNVTASTTTVDRIRVSSSGGKLLVYLYNTAGALIQGNFQFTTFK